MTNPLLHLWQALDAWLARHAVFWQSIPFYTPHPHWAHTHPQLRTALLNLSETERIHFSQQPTDMTQWLSPWLPDLALGTTLLASLDQFAPADLEMASKNWTLSETQAPRMPERKRHQAGQLTACLHPFNLPITDWCSGMGHLTRTLAIASPYPVVGLEWDIELVKRGQQWIHATNCPQQMAVQLHQQNVLQLTKDHPQWPHQHHLIALHACGDLHRHLLRQAISANQPRISLVPCCYHLSDQQYWQPLAHTSQTSALQGLTYAQLRLAVQETVTAPARATRQRETMNIWRLGYEALRQNLTQDPHYKHLASCSIQLLQQGFTAFCGWAAQAHHLPLPEWIDEHYWIEQGRQRAMQVQRDELLRHQFRRPLEVWLLLDYLLFLQEAGYQVSIKPFCSPSLSPRNLLIEGLRSP